MTFMKHLILPGPLLSLHVSKQHDVHNGIYGSYRGGTMSKCYHVSTLLNAKRYNVVKAVETASVLYHDWAREQGVEFDKVEQKVFDDMRGMVALDDIKNGEIFVTLPRSAALVVDPLDKCPCAEFVDPGYYKKCPWYVKMAILLLFERNKGPSSRVFGYIKQLPDSIDTPVRWSEQELDELQNPSFKDSVMQQKIEWKRLFTEFQRNSRGASENYDDFLWALENVRSRSFSGPYAGSPIKDRVTMAALLAAAGAGYAALSHIPLESVLNAGISVACFNLIYDLVLSSRLKWDTFVVSTDMNYGKGSQIFISYGEKTNEQLLQYYGFVLDDNLHDVYNVNATIGGSEVTLSIKPNGLLSKQTMAKLEKDESLRSKISGKFSDAVNEALIDAINLELRNKKSSLSDDQRLLNSKGMIKSVRLATAIAFRLSQKHILENSLNAAKKRQSA